MIASQVAKKLKHCKPGLEHEDLLVFCSVYTKWIPVNEIYIIKNQVFPSPPLPLLCIAYTAVYCQTVFLFVKGRGRL